LTSLDRLAYIKTLTNFNYFNSGEFISDYDEDRYMSLLAQVVPAAKEIFPEQAALMGNEPINLTMLFRNIYIFRYQMHLHFNFSLSMHADQKFSMEQDYSLHVRKKFVERMKDNLVELDDMLCLYIDPEKRVFDANEIGYSEFDFDVIDEEWRRQFHR